MYSNPTVNMTITVDQVCSEQVEFVQKQEELFSNAK